MRNSSWLRFAADRRAVEKLRHQFIVSSEYRYIYLQLWGDDFETLERIKIWDAYMRAHRALLLPYQRKALDAMIGVS